MAAPEDLGVPIGQDVYRRLAWAVESHHHRRLRLAAAERRAIDRTRADGVPVRLDVVDGVRRTLDATLHDVSPEGVSVRTARPLRPGSRVIVTVGEGPDAVVVPTAVRYCRADGATSVSGLAAGGKADPLVHAMLPPDLPRFRRTG